MTSTWNNRFSEQFCATLQDRFNVVQNTKTNFSGTYVGHIAFMSYTYTFISACLQMYMQIFQV